MIETAGQRKEKLIAPGEIEALAARYGAPERRRVALELGEKELEYWREKSARRRGEDQADPQPSLAVR